MQIIFTKLGYGIASCHAVENAVFELYSVLKAMADLSQKKKLNGNMPLDESELDPILAKVRNKYKKLTHEKRIDELHQLAPTLITEDDKNLLHSARKIRNKLSHNYVVENTFLLFTLEKQNQLIAEIDSYRAELSQAFALVSARHEEIAKKLGVNIDSIWDEFLIEAFSDSAA
ncbi:hypothetical protein J7X22_000298 [Vibrio parahaemolyticus]|nr:hypothetical protein [Vibrio parahaemolyticus]